MKKTTITMTRRLLLLVLAAATMLPALAQGDSLRAGADTLAARRYDTYFWEAMLQRQKHHNDAAFELLRRCIEIRPQASEAHFFLGQYYDGMTGKENKEKALQCFERAFGLSPGNATYMETLAQAYVERQQFAEATTVVEKLYESDKSRQDLLEMLYRLYLEQRDYEKAIGVIDRMELIDGKTERTSLAKSSLLIQNGDKQQAIGVVKALAEEHPSDLNYRTLYANTLMMDDQQELAVEVLREVLAEEPANYRAQVAMRTYYLMEQDTLRADSLTRSILLNPNTGTDDKVNLMRQEISHSEANGGDSTRVLSLFRDMLALPEPDAGMAEFCAAYMNLKKMPRDTIQHMLRFVLKLAPDNASARLQLVQYAWEDDDNRQVVELCRDARQYNPEEMAFYYYQGMAYYRNEDTDRALEAFQNGISVISEESNPAIVSDFYAVMGDLLHQKGRYSEAYEAYDSCLQWKPDNIGCLNNYAYFLCLDGEQLDRAEQMSYKAIKAEPKNATYLDTYAWIMFAQKRYAEARIYIDQTLQNDSVPSADLLEHAGDIYALNGDMESAVDFWQRALGKKPKDKALMRKIKRRKYQK